MRLKHARLLNFILIAAMIFAIAVQWWGGVGVLFALFVLNMVF